MSKKIIVLGIVLMTAALLVNVTLGNLDVAGLDRKNGDSERSFDGKTSDSDFIKIKNHHETIFVKISDILKDSIQNPDMNESDPQMDDLLNQTQFVGDDSEQVGRFSSYDEFKSYLENRTNNYGWYYSGAFVPTPTVIGAMPRVSEGVTLDFDDMNTVYASTVDYSTTNVQIYGVDEGDIIKNDGEFAYIVAKDRQRVFVVDVFPAEEASMVSTIKTTGSISEIYLIGDTLVVLGSRQITQIDPSSVSDDFQDTITLEVGSFYYFNYLSYQSTFIELYDITDKEAPVLSKAHFWNGWNSQSRMIGDHLYLILSQYIYSTIQKWNLPCSASEIYYFQDQDNSSLQSYSHQLTTILSVNVLNPSEEPNKKVILLDQQNNIFVSQKNIYITESKYISGNQKTVIHRISILSGNINYKAKGEVLGYVPNRFCMDEYQDYFRVTTNSWRSSNSVYVLDMDLKIVGNVSNIAPGERIYSTRFVKDRVYLVTFRVIDPFFVISLSDPENPEILGELKIPGFSNYLHPYDENHVIGLGQEINTDGRGRLGVKLSLFDVTDVKNPVEKYKYIIGDSYTSSPAQNDPHAFMFSREKNLLVLPISLNYTYRGAYVFDISLEEGFILKGTIDHHHDSDEQTGNYYYYYYSNAIKRSFYIQDTIYTLSSDYLKMNDLSDLHEIKELNLPSEIKTDPEPPSFCIWVEPISGEW
ncbi:MAG: beta-propeller domain-containing protein [Thermoplasmata archaeon]